MMSVISKNSEQTRKIGARYAAELKGGEVICLFGELGTGKTTYTQGLARGLGITQSVVSPTFIVVRRYPITGRTFQYLYHIDLYRMHDSAEVMDVGVSEFFHDPENVVVIEWPERLGEFIPLKRTDIYFSYISENKREIRFDERLK